MTSKAIAHKERITRDDRLGFRLDEQTKALIERAAQLERRKVSDFCVSAISDAARRTIAQHETLLLSERDRTAFFQALLAEMSPRSPVRGAMTIPGTSSPGLYFESSNASFSASTIQ